MVTGKSGGKKRFNKNRRHSVLLSRDPLAGNISRGPLWGNNPQSSVLDYEPLVHDVVEWAIRAGASEAQAVVSFGDDFTVTVRRGDIETLEQASPKTLGLRVITDHKQALSSTSDFESRSLRKFIAETVAMSRLLSPDSAHTLPPEVPVLPDLDLRLHDSDLENVSPEQKIELAMRAEAAAASYDPRITNSEGSVYSDHIGTAYLANSHGLSFSYRGTSAQLYTVPLAEDNGKKESAWYYTVKRFFRELKSPEDLGREAARRAVGKLGARKVKTQRAAVIFDYPVAGGLWSVVFQALQGDMIYKNMSFLNGYLGKTVASPLVTLIDDGLLVKGLGSCLLDGEGELQRCNVLINRGELRMYTYDTYYANKVGTRSTGNSHGGVGIGPTNCYLTPSRHLGLAQIIRATDRGLLVTDLLGSNVNVVSGDYSVGAAGYWIEDGALAYPVHEVTIAGHMLDMMQQVDMVANDMEVWGGISSPPFRIGEIAIAGT